MVTVPTPMSAGRPMLWRRSSTGTMTPRRFSTPRTTSEAPAMRVGVSKPRISCTRRMSTPYSSLPTWKARYSRTWAAASLGRPARLEGEDEVDSSMR